MIVHDSLTLAVAIEDNEDVTKLTCCNFIVLWLLLFPAIKVGFSDIFHLNAS